MIFVGSRGLGHVTKMVKKKLGDIVILMRFKLLLRWKAGQGLLKDGTFPSIDYYYIPIFFAVQQTVLYPKHIQNPKAAYYDKLRSY